MSISRTLLTGTAAAVLLALAGCATPQTVRRRSSLLEYLYPSQAQGQAQPATPSQPPAQPLTLPVPTRVGVAFVPTEGGSRQDRELLRPGEEGPLLDLVIKAFQGRPWISEVKRIPSNYLQPRGGFDNLKAVSQMYGVDVVALVSVDQIQYTDPKWYSFVYYTIVGAYVLPGDRNDTRTFIDAAVFDPGSRTFILRASGTSDVKGSSSFASREKMLRENAHQGLELAMADLTKNLDKSVDEFKAEVQSGQRPSLDLVDAQGRSLQQTGGKNWGGAFGAWELLAALGMLAWLRRRT
jgi:rhombotail lipoprotein